MGGEGGTLRDTWSAGQRYEPYVGRWSRLVAAEMLAWLQPGPALDWLDVGCGTGALTEVMLARVQPKNVRGIDPSPGFIEHARANVADSRATFEVGDAQALPFSDSQFDACVSGLVLNFVPQPQRAVSEFARVVRPGGMVAAYVWDYAGKMELMRYFWDAAVELDPAVAALDEGRRFPLCQPQPLRDLFTQANLLDVDVIAIDVPTRFENFDDYWTPFLGGQGPAPSYAVALPDERRATLRDRLRSRLPSGKDGAIDLVARAWAIRARIPEKGRA